MTVEDDERPKRHVFKRILAYAERLPFAHGHFFMFKADNQHAPITNRGEQDLPVSRVPSEIQADAIEKEKQRRAMKDRD